MYRPLHAAVAGLLLWALQARDIVIIPHGAQQHGIQQQMRAVSRCQLM